MVKWPTGHFLNAGNYLIWWHASQSHQSLKKDLAIILVIDRKSGFHTPLNFFVLRSI